jgi:hypothetical protein
VAPEQQFLGNGYRVADPTGFAGIEADGRDLALVPIVIHALVRSFDPRSPPWSRSSA